MHTHDKRSLTATTLTAIGVVYGDIGTSPLYTLKECFTAAEIVPSQSSVLGILSLIFWAILLVVTIKYVTFILRADYRGEGGIMVLMALARRYVNGKSRGKIVVLGLFGAALFYGDAIITPAMSVLSAAEGLEVLYGEASTDWIVLMAITVLLGLFLLQRFGTWHVGKMFGPIMVIWFCTLSILGLLSIIQSPLVLHAVNPIHALHFIAEHQGAAFLAMGSVVLALTGAEALYADMGHFGRGPIRIAWFSLVLPALLLNYFGQGALLLAHSEAIQNPFFLLAPHWALLPLIILATLATIIASQAVISGAYSLTRQAIQLGFCPRMAIDHTSEQEIGQIYLPFVNWALLIAVLVVVVTFRSSAHLAAAYGIAVTGTMLITSLLFFVIARSHWGWSLPATLGLTSVFLVIDILFFSANLLKLPHGGWLPLLIGCAIFTLMLTWRQGRKLLQETMRAQALPLDSFIANLEEYPPVRVQGTAVFLTGALHGVPHALLHNLKHNKVLHERVVLATIKTEDVPYVDSKERVEIKQLSPSFWHITAHYGFMESPNMDAILAQCAQAGLSFELMDTSFFLSRETLIPAKRSDFARWRQGLFAWMNRNALRATDFFQIPPNRVVEMGAQVQL